MSYNLNMTEYPVAGVSKLLATNGGAHILSVALDSDEVLWNGAIIGVDDYEGFEYFGETTPTTFTGKVVGQAANGNYYVQVLSAENAFLVYNAPVVEFNNLKGYADEKYFCLKGANGDMARAHELKKYDIFELSADGFSGTVTVGATISSVSGKKPVASGVSA